MGQCLTLKPGLRLLDYKPQAGGWLSGSGAAWEAVLTGLSMHQQFKYSTHIKARAPCS